MNRTVLDLWVGFFVVLGFAALVFLAVKVGSYAELSSGQSYTVEAAFDNLGGLKARAPVKSAGVLVGRVNSIRFDPQSFRAVVKIDLDARYEFPKDTSASILTSGLLGEQYIGLDPGGDVDVLKEGDALQITQSAVVLEKLIGQFLFNKAAETPPAPTQ
jgi:phospholipid/cholesterol/gamma-HCH transport system substrate-binding protein